ncbi:hypothetical protein [Nocardiopsis potens]|uniref:hypothetical protein n=1 Tax=Nocardiopsis potens TaxID=1246458 RepID=UPI00035FB6E5
MALLGVPRVVAHDLGPPPQAVNAVLVFVPVAVWIAVALRKRVPSPLVTLLAVGLVYGVLLGAVHQVLWTHSFAGGAPELGGNLAGTLSPAAEDLVLRGASMVSSLFTGALVGLISGLVALGLSRALHRK